MRHRLAPIAAGAALLTAIVLPVLLLIALPARAQQPPGRESFQKLVLVPPDDRDYILLKVPAGARVVITDVIAYNAADGKGHKASPAAESYLWFGGYVGGKSTAVIDRMRLMGNEVQQWHMQTGFELSGAPEFDVSSEPGSPSPSPALVYVNGYVQH